MSLLSRAGAAEVVDTIVTDVPTHIFCTVASAVLRSYSYSSSCAPTTLERICRYFAGTADVVVDGFDAEVASKVANNYNNPTHLDVGVPEFLSYPDFPQYIYAVRAVLNDIAIQPIKQLYIPGAPGDIVTLTGTVEGFRSGVGKYNVNLYSFDCQGRMVNCFTSRELPVHVGDTVTFMCELSRFGVYNGAQETQVNHIVFLNDKD